jgi:hypothetical protein
MKIKQKKKMMFGDLIIAAPKNWGACRDKLAINTRPLMFRGQPHFSISAAKGRFV